MNKHKIVAIIGPTASGKSAKAISLALERNGEVISVDSRQVYRTLDIGTEKISVTDMQGVPHHLIDICEPEERYSAGDFVNDASRLIDDITARGKLAILAGGTHFYFDALLNGIPGKSPPNHELRAVLEKKTTEDLFTELQIKDPRRAQDVDPRNARRLVRALELVDYYGKVPERIQKESVYDVEWIVINPHKEELRERIDVRLENALKTGLVEEVRKLRERVGDERLNELGLEYRIVGEFLRGERDEDSLLPSLSSKLWGYARQQKAWIRKLKASNLNDH